jgi:hypothetical protein
MTATLEKITKEIKALPQKDLEEFLEWLADYELSKPDAWDLEIERDSQPGGRLDSVLKNVRADISAGKTRPLDEVINLS